MNNLINIEDLTVEEIDKICIRANEFEKGIRKSNHSNAHVINMFFEDSTRTRISFEMAENKLSINKYNFSVENSSLNKGEDLFDTINNLSAMGVNIAVIRHREDSIIKELSEKRYYKEIRFINAGSGVISHPTQALLDFYTLKKHFLELQDKTITIVGDVAHSRVARSNIALLKKYGMNIRCLAPEYLMGDKLDGVEYFTSLEEAFENTDVVMALRIQKERIQGHVDIDEYIKKYQITKENLPYAAFLMHPGPVNKNIEIKEDVLLTQNAKTILNQATNGVYVRMAVLDMMLVSLGV